MIRVPGTTFRMGSTHAETLEAAADCAREPFGFRCNDATFSDEMPSGFLADIRTDFSSVRSTRPYWYPLSFPVRQNC